MEVPMGDDLPLFGPAGVSLKELVERLDKAAADPAVKAVVIVPGGASVGLAQVEELRGAIARVRRHKEVHVHADSLDMGQYVLASGATRISVVPTGALIVPGLHGSSLHVRGLLDKIGVKPDFIAEGAYKSAAELFMREQPSPEADEMMNWLMDSLYSTVTELVASGRNVDVAKAREWFDTGLFTAEQAKAAGLIDAVEQHEDFESMLTARYGARVVFDRKYGKKASAELDLSSPLALFKIWGDLLRGPQPAPAAKPAVGIVYVSGPILPGEGSSNPLGSVLGAFSTDVREAIEEAAEDPSIRAVVLRIDSPGGSATASEIILDATKRLKARKKLVVSMGNVAGSGGYYVACGADTIFADAATLTGSIGVVGGKLATTEMWKKVGITFKDYKRGENAGILSSSDVFNERERARMREFMADVYRVFTNHVAAIRGDRLRQPLDSLTGGRVDSLTGGRVYTGKQALELGLVDRLGTLRDAVAFAAEQAGLDDYDVRVVPEPKGFLDQLLEQLSGGEDKRRVQLGAGGGMLLRLAAPYLQGLDPERTGAILSALCRLEVLRQERVALSMPEFLFE